MAKKTKRAASKRTAAKGVRKSASASRRTNVQILVDEGALNAEAARRLNPSAVRQINGYTRRDVKFLITHQLRLCGVARPAPDGSFF